MTSFLCMTSIRHNHLRNFPKLCLAVTWLELASEKTPDCRLAVAGVGVPTLIVPEIKKTGVCIRLESTAHSGHGVPSMRRAERLRPSAQRQPLLPSRRSPCDIIQHSAHRYRCMNPVAAQVLPRQFPMLSWFALQYV